jgi:hypothetical protein
MTNAKQYPGLLIDNDPADRRCAARFPSELLTVQLRRRGSLRRVTGKTLDFNRFGVAVLATKPMILDVLIYIELSYPSQDSDLSVVGVVHNCVRQGDLFRCGIRFRPQSSLQKYPTRIEPDLLALEHLVANTESA